jgi:DeoR/GlpR family transcriptional regulator of sugar metabolism
LAKSRSKERKEARQKKIISLLESKQARNSSSGLEVHEIAVALDVSDATIRGDLSSMNDTTNVDDSRKPWKYFVKGKHTE